MQTEQHLVPNFLQLSTAELEEACRTRLGWSDEHIARTRKIDMRAALALLPVPAAPAAQPPSVKSSPPQHADQVPPQPNQPPPSLEQQENVEVHADALFERIEAHAKELELVAQYTDAAAPHYLPSAPKLFQRLAATTHDFVRDLRTLYSQNEHTLQRLRCAANVGVHAPTHPNTAPDLQSISRDFQTQRQAKIAELQRIQFTYGEMLRRLNTLLQMSSQIA